METKKELKVKPIREGTVIDHINAKNTFKVVEILNLKEVPGIVSIATNLPSKRLGKKGIIKIGGKFLTEEEVSRISVAAPEATINIIEYYGVKKKFKVTIPKRFDNIIKCSNPKCITNMEKVKSSFNVIGKKPLKVICNYCERVMEADDIKLL